MVDRKRKIIDDDLFAKTTPESERPAENEDLDQGRIVSTGVGVTEGELKALGELAERYEVTRNALMRWAIRLFIIGVREGKINPNDYFIEPEKPKKRSRIGKQTRE